MSEPTPVPPAQRKGSKKLGPLPWWGWGLIAAAVVAGVVIWRKNSAASQGAASQSGAAAPESVVPVPTGTGLTGSQYAALAAQNAAIFEAIQDMQGEPSRPKDRDTNRDEGRGDRDRDRDRDNVTVTTGPGGVAGGTGRGGGGDTGPPSRRRPHKTSQGGNNPPIYK